ncbi:hypothetical protein ACFWGI_29130 [Streptomyces niveus]|uniref:hypothetical protein n=1 Tax=Streptomyces niveus TaxID=193462 RepID=UPI0036552009
MNGFSLKQTEAGINTELVGALKLHRMPTPRDRSLLGHLQRSMQANPQALSRCGASTRRCCRTALGRCCWVRSTPLVVEQVSDGGFRTGEMHGLHLCDLHLRDGAACRECRGPHAHVCHRDGLFNGARKMLKAGGRRAGLRLIKSAHLPAYLG